MSNGYQINTQASGIDSIILFTDSSLIDTKFNFIFNIDKNESLNVFLFIKLKYGYWATLFFVILSRKLLRKEKVKKITQIT